MNGAYEATCLLVLEPRTEDRGVSDGATDTVST